MSVSVDLRRMLAFAVRQDTFCVTCGTRKDIPCKHGIGSTNHRDSIVTTKCIACPMCSTCDDCISKYLSECAELTRNNIDICTDFCADCGHCTKHPCVHRCGDHSTMGPAVHPCRKHIGCPNCDKECIICKHNYACIQDMHKRAGPDN